MSSLRTVAPRSKSYLLALRKVSAALFLTVLAGFFTANVTQAQVTSPTLQFSDPGSLVVGQPAEISLTISESALSMDGIQLDATFSGPSLSDPQLLINPELLAQAVKEEITSSGFSVILLPENLTPFKFGQKTQLVTLRFTPQESGLLKISFNAKNTLAADSLTSKNALVFPMETVLRVGEVPQLPTEQRQLALEQNVVTPLDSTLNDQPPQDQNATLVLVGSATALIVMIVIAMLAWYKIIYQRLR